MPFVGEPILRFFETANLDLNTVVWFHDHAVGKPALCFIHVDLVPWLTCGMDLQVVSHSHDHLGVAWPVFSHSLAEWLW